jgi:thiosulfate/3-mercaptopyruvate sulfurtransferase
VFTTLIEPAVLAEHTADADWAVIDCRFELTQPEWGRGAYEQGHIPSALYAHLDRDLSGPVTPDSGRHPLPAREVFAARLAAWGVDSKVQIVAYDQGHGAYAARLWWLARWEGHVGVAVLNGGFAAWQQAGLPVSQHPGARPARRFAPGKAIADVITTQELAQLLASGQLEGARTLIDARSADRFAGRNETIDPVGGHVPGARNHPFTTNLDSDGRFLQPALLRERWTGELPGQDPAKVISMCGSGVTACHNLLALEIAGLPGAKLYAGSWSEWVRDAARPVAR